MRIIAVLLFTVAAIIPALAQDGDRSKRIELAMAFVELTSADAVLNPMVDAVWPSVEMQLGSNVDPELSNRLKTMFGAEVKAALADVLEQYAGFYADAFTLEELQQINKFYLSGVGAKLIVQQAAIAEQMIPAITARLTETLPGAMQRILEEAEGEGLTLN